MEKKLHEILAIEKESQRQVDAMAAETQGKFNKESTYFKGRSSELTLLGDDASLRIKEEQAREFVPLTTTVIETFAYVFDLWQKNEALQVAKNEANTRARADLVWRDKVLHADVPVDELMGLEARLQKLNLLVKQAPTLAASRVWRPDSARVGAWNDTMPIVREKTEKREIVVVMSPATDKHPAQTKMVEKEVVIGKTTVAETSGAFTTLQKANLIRVLEELVAACRQARMRANQVMVDPGVGNSLAASVVGAFHYALDADDII